MTVVTDVTDRIVVTYGTVVTDVTDLTVVTKDSSNVRDSSD